MQQDRKDPWTEHMLNGAFEEAWKVSDAVLQERTGKPCWHLPRHQQYIWDGSSLKDKRVLIRCYHGLGDTIQFIRYAPLVKAIAKEVIVWAQPSLLSLLETIAGIDRLLPLHDGTPEVDYDVDVEVMELPHIFRTTADTMPKKVSYLHVEPLRLSSREKFSVGLVWKAGDWDHRRNIPFDDLLPLFNIENCDVYILQANAKVAGWHKDLGIHVGEFLLYDYARLIKGLDLLITIDSMPAHLAGAMAVPVWTLLHADADWRWMRSRSNSPWYPTMRLFRQEVQDEWQGVVQTVKNELTGLVRRRGERMAVGAKRSTHG